MMDQQTVDKFVSALFDISCKSHEYKTQMSSKSHHKVFINILNNNVPPCETPIINSFL